MKRKSVRLKSLLIIVAFMICVLSVYAFFYGSSIHLTSKHADFIEENGRITRVDIAGSFPYGIIQVEEDKEIIDANDQLLKQIIQSYDVQAKCSIRMSLSTKIYIEESESTQYIYYFKFSDKTLVIKDGLIQETY